MALTTERIKGEQLTITVNGTITRWQTFDIETAYGEDDATASDSDLDQVVLIKRKLTGKLTGFLGSVNNGGSLPAEADVITSLNAAVGADSILVSGLTSTFTNISVTKIAYNTKLGPATFSVEFRSGVVG